MIYVVSGMARTGTSMMMHALIKGGIPAIYDVGKGDARLMLLNAMGYDANHDGLFELQKPNLLKRFPDDLDTELVKIADFQWELLSGQAENGIRVVYMLREKESTMMSLAAFTGAEDLSEYEERWNHQQDYIKQIMSRKDILSINIFHFEDVVADPVPHFNKLKRAGWPIDVNRAVSVVKPELHHFRSTK